MNITFKTNFRSMTYKNYIQQPKQMVELALIKKLATNPELIKNLDRFPHPLIGKYKKCFMNKKKILLTQFKLIEII